MDCLVSTGLAVAIPVSYVALIYLFDTVRVRNDPESIKRRFLAATVNNVVSVGLTWLCLRRVRGCYCD